MMGGPCHGERVRPPKPGIKWVTIPEIVPGKGLVSHRYSVERVNGVPVYLAHVGWPPAVPPTEPRP